MSKRISWKDVYSRLQSAPEGGLYGIPRGGSVIAGLTGRAVDHPEEADWLVDDFIDSGQTARLYEEKYKKPVWALFDRRSDPSMLDGNLVFPWQDARIETSRHHRLVSIGHELLRTIGYDPRDPILAKTPERWASWWEEFVSETPTIASTSFTNVGSNEMVIVSGISLWSLCEHHLLPFSATVAVGYIPKDKLLGLSKFARIAHRIARRLQIQERLVAQIADELAIATGSADVAVLARGRHLCLEARGARTTARMTNYVFRGTFQAHESKRIEFLKLAR